MSSAIGVPVVSRREVFYAPLKRLDPWKQSDPEKAVCIVTLAARDSAKATGIFCKIGPELVVLCTTMLIGSESSGSFATAEFYSTGAAKPEHHVKLDPKIMYESMDIRMEGGKGQLERERGGGVRQSEEGRSGGRRKSSSSSQQRNSKQVEEEDHMIELEEGGMAILGCPKSGAPKFEVEGGKKGVFIDLPPMELCTNLMQLPKVGE
jgi:hypothetical protein